MAIDSRIDIASDRLLTVLEEIMYTAIDSTDIETTISNISAAVLDGNPGTKIPYEVLRVESCLSLDEVTAEVQILWNIEMPLEVQSHRKWKIGCRISNREFNHDVMTQYARQFIEHVAHEEADKLAKEIKANSEGLVSEWVSIEELRRKEEHAREAQLRHEESERIRMAEESEWIEKQAKHDAAMADPMVGAF